MSGSAARGTCGEQGGGPPMGEAKGGAQGARQAGQTWTVLGSSPHCPLCRVIRHVPPCPHVWLALICLRAWAETWQGLAHRGQYRLAGAAVVLSLFCFLAFGLWLGHSERYWRVLCC